MRNSYCEVVHTYPHIRSLTVSRFSCVLFDPAQRSIPQFIATVLVPGLLASQVGGGETGVGGGLKRYVGPPNAENLPLIASFRNAKPYAKCEKTRDYSFAHLSRFII